MRFRRKGTVRARVGAQGGAYNAEGSSRKEMWSARVPRAALDAPLQASFLRPVLPAPLQGAVGLDIDVPFYASAPCSLPSAWSGGVSDFCLHEAGNLVQCNAAFPYGPWRTQCYCGALGGSAEACGGEGGAFAVETGQALLSSCTARLQQARAEAFDGQAR